jgi:hypothetical protein
MNGRILGSRSIHKILNWKPDEADPSKGTGSSLCSRFAGRVAVTAEPANCSDCRWIRYGAETPTRDGKKRND